jgi:hypothetical protein
VFEPRRAALIVRAPRADQLATMNSRAALIKQLVDNGSYPLDETAIAEAILVRSMARRVMPDVVFRLAAPKPPVRSFRHHSGARSFRLHRAERRPTDLHVAAAGAFARAA